VFAGVGHRPFHNGLIAYGFDFGIAAKMAGECDVAEIRHGLSLMKCDVF
jgi:hypothetical protein